MSYNFYSLVSSIKDKSSQALNTLSSDLKEFSSIIQEDAAEVAKTVRQTVQETSESLRQRAEEKEQSEQNTQEQSENAAMSDEDKPQLHHEELKHEGNEADTEESDNRGSFFSFGGALPSLSSLSSLEAMGSKLLNSADEFLGALAGDAPGATDTEDLQSESELSARRFRLLALQEDADTYIDPPLDFETFQKWQAGLSDQDWQTLRDEVLAHYPTVGAKEQELVPDVLPSETFWAHYLYKASLLAAQEQRGADLLEHALNDSEEEISWDVDSPKHEDGSKFFPTEESKQEEPSSATSSPVTGSAAAGNSESSDGESWIELDERKDQGAPLSMSSIASSLPENNAAPSTAAKADEVADGEDDLDWGDDDEDTTAQLAEGSTTTAAGETPVQEDGKPRGGDWGEWD